MKIVITNTAALNTGDAAILFATIDILRQVAGPHLDVAVCDQHAPAARRYYADLDFQPLFFDQIAVWAGTRWTKGAILLVLAAATVWRCSPLRWLCRRFLPTPLCANLDRFAAAELVISAGGTYLVPHYRIFPKIIDLLVAVALRRPFVLFTQSLGPFPRRRAWLLRYVLSRARLILVRDARSRRHLLDFGVPADHIAECADSAFALAPKRLSRSTGGQSAAERTLRVAISVRDWPHFADTPDERMAGYLDAVAALVRRLVEQRDAEVAFLSTCQGVSEYWTNDSRVAEAVVARLPAETAKRVRVDRDFHTPQALMALYGDFDIVVATRMHAAILALCAGVPVLPLAYEFKTEELFVGLGLGDYVQPIDTLSGEGLCRTFDRLLRARATLRQSLPARIAEARRSAFAAGSYVFCALGRNP